MSAPQQPRVLVFDSGVGGLSVAHCIRRQLPETALVYLADNAGFPYGNQPEAVVIDRCTALTARAVRDYVPDVIVVACNTASTVVLPALRAMTPVPVVGVVPAIKPAAACTLNRRIGLLATPATVRRPYIDRLIEEFAGDCTVERVGHPGLVTWAEQLVSGQAVPQAELDVAMEPFRVAEVDTVVLGCTHYPLLLDNLRKSLPDVQFWVDSGEAIARRVAWLLAEAGGWQHARSAVPISARRPTLAALFSGAAPAGIVRFMAQMDLAPEYVAGGWPGER